jgi:hypothetical protein
MLFDDGSAFDMLYDLAQDKVERFIIMPFLESIYDNGDETDKYWLFLKNGYDSWFYQSYNADVIEGVKEEYHAIERYPLSRYGVSPSSVILSLVLKINNLDNLFSLDAGDDIQYKELIFERLYGELLGSGLEKDDNIIVPVVRLPKEVQNTAGTRRVTRLHRRLIMGKDGKPVEFGYIYNFKFELAITNPDKYSAMKALWENDECPARPIYTAVGQYYQMLKEKHLHATELDDDDF